jgi:L-2-hydroxyglutarate oxidase LhgO
VQRLVPELRAQWLRPAPSGVRAQALGPDGELVDEFLIEETARGFHVLNAPSPAATAALSIASSIVERLVDRGPGS